MSVKPPCEVSARPQMFTLEGARQSPYSSILCAELITAELEEQVS